MVEFDYENAKERSNMVCAVKNLTTSGENLYAQGGAEVCNETAQQLFQEGQEKLQQAAVIREEFWDKYPNALIDPNCPWMAKDVYC